MTAKTHKIEVRIPIETIVPFKEIAKLAGLSVESVIKLALATEVWRQKNNASEKPDNY